MTTVSPVTNVGATKTDDKVELPLLPLSHPKVTLADALAAGEQIAQRLRLLSDSVGPAYMQNQFYRRVRVKAQSSLREKVKRKQQGGMVGKIRMPARPLYSFRDMTDIVGFRIVTLYDNDLSMAKDHILDVVAVGQQEPQPLFNGNSLWDAFDEAHFYLREQQDIYQSCADELDEKIREDCAEWKNLNDILKRVTGIKPTPNGQQYSSAHLIFNAVAHFKDWRMLLPVEFQLRTAIEDIWAEVNHKLLYKIRNPYVWNLKFELAYKGAVSASTALKSATATFPTAVGPFLEFSKEAQKGLASFADPGVATYFSLCMSLFSAIGDSAVDTFEKPLAEYKALLKDITLLPPGGKKADRFRTARGWVREIIAALEATKRKYKSDDPEFMLIVQRVALCELELLRLEILIVVSCRYRLEKNGELTWLGPAAMQKEWEESCAAVYKRLCDYRSNPEPLVRPSAMVLYWKYWIAFVFDKRVARRNIETAYEELKFDASLPNYSIYRILIPRMLSLAIHYDVANSIKTFRDLSSDPADMHGLSGDMKTELVNAIGYAFEAYKANRIPHDNRGDIVFGREPIDEVTDALGVLNIYSYFSKTFDSCITESKQISHDDIIEALGFLKKYKLETLTREEDRQAVQQTIRDAEAALKRARARTTQKKKANA